MKSRAFHKTYAMLHGYFWLPCPTCGNYFGGHEWVRADGHESSIPDPEHPGDGSRGTGICPDCATAGKGDQAWSDFEDTYGPRWGLTH